MPRQIVRFVLAVLILASLFGGRSLVANVADGSGHTVKPGETLSGIAVQYGLTVEQLTTLNGITDPNRVVEGQTLKLPPATSTARAGNQPAAQQGSAAQAQPAAQPAPQTVAQSAPTPAGGEYVVQPGDTLSGIAKALGVGLKALLDANELADADRLIVGQKLTVPAGAQAPGAVPAGRSNQPGGATANGAAAPAPAASAPAPAPSDEAGGTLDRLAQQYGVEPALVRALAWIDSDGKPRKLDAPGGIGYLTVTDKTFEYIQGALVKRALDRANPGDNVEAGIAYVASMLKWGGEETKGLAGFIQGPGSVRTNGIRPATDEQIKRIQALRDRLKSGLPAQTVANAPTTGPGRGGASAGQQLTMSNATANLSARVISAARSVAGPNARIGVAGRNLVTGQRIGVSSEQTFPAASVGKLALMVEAYRQNTNGTITLSEAQRSDLRAMVVSSDNDAANRIMELLSTRAVNANLQAIGLAGTRLGNPFGLAHATGTPQNLTTPLDMSRLMDMLATEQLVSSAASREMRGLLLQSQDGSKLKRGLPLEARLAHKSGWYDGVANDVGIVSHGQSSYVVAVFTEGIADAEIANQTIASVAQTVHAAWGPER